MEHTVYVELDLGHTDIVRGSCAERGSSADGGVIDRSGNGHAGSNCVRNIIDGHGNCGGLTDVAGSVIGLGRKDDTAVGLSRRVPAVAERGNVACGLEDPVLINFDLADRNIVRCSGGDGLGAAYRYIVGRSRDRDSRSNGIGSDSHDDIDRLSHVIGGVIGLRHQRVGSGGKS